MSRPDAGDGSVLVREVVRPRWAPFRLGPPSLDGLTRRRGNGLVRLLHVDGEPVVVAVAGHGVRRAGGRPRRRRATGSRGCASRPGSTTTSPTFHARFRDDPVIGRAVRAYPWLRVRRNPDPWETLMWSITEQLIDMPRATAIQRRMIAALGPPLRRACATRRRRTTIAACAPAELEACGLHAKRALAMRARARGEVAPRAASSASASRRREALASRRRAAPRCSRSPRSGTWTVEMVALHGLGRLDVVPAGDLGYLKLVGRLATGRPKAIADEAEVRGFFAPYAPWAGLAASYLIRARTIPGPPRAGTRWSAAAPRKAAA